MMLLSNFLTKGKWRQIVTTATVTYSLVSVGMAMVWTSPVLRELQGPNSPLLSPPTLQEQEWLGSLFLLGGTFGPIATVPLTRVVGRRWLVIGMAIPLILGWTLAGAATDIYYMYAARFLWGCSFGIAMMLVPIYTGEIAEDSIRGALGSFAGLLLHFGFFLTYLIGRFTNYWGLTAVGGVLSLVYLGLSWSLPETPYYLIFKGRKAEASAVLQKLRCATEEQVSAELKMIENMIERDYIEKPKISDLWSSAGSLKALGICMVITTMIQLSGINVILFFLEELFVKLKVNMSSADVPVLIGLVQIVAGCITPFIVEKLGRRFILYSTLLGMSISQAVVATYTMLESCYKIDVSSVTFIPLLFIMIHIVLFSWGVGPIAIILLSEMFRPKVKCFATALCSSLCWFSGFLLTRFYSELTTAHGEYSGFWLLSAFCAFGAVFSFCFLIETQGKTFDQIQDELNNRSSQKETEISNVSR